MNDRDRTVSDAEADRSIESLQAGQIVPASEFAKWADSGMEQVTNSKNGNVPNKLGTVELRFLAAVVRHPMRPSSEYAKLAGMSPNTLRKIRLVLVEKGFIRENRLEKEDRGRVAILLEPLEQAKQLFKDSKE